MSKLSEGIWIDNAAVYLLGGGGEEEGRRLKTSSYSVVARKGDKKSETVRTATAYTQCRETVKLLKATLNCWACSMYSLLTNDDVMISKIWIHKQEGDMFWLLKMTLLWLCLRVPFVYRCEFNFETSFTKNAVCPSLRDWSNFSTIFFVFIVENVK